MKILVLSDEDYSFIMKFDPDRDRAANRAQLVEVIAEIQDILDDSPTLDLVEDDE